MNFFKWFRLFKPSGSHKRIVKLMEIKQSLGILTVVIFVFAELMIVGFIGNKFMVSDKPEVKYDKNIAVLNLNEAITSEYIGRVMERLDYIQENKKYFPELLVVMNCPGGSATASEEMRRYLDDFQKEGIKLTMYVESMAASGGYYIATTARYNPKDALSGIIANQNSMVGSIGVIIAYPILEEAAKKLGVKYKSITMGKYKEPLSMFKDPSKEEEKYIKDQFMMPVYQNFLKMVAKGRDMSLDALKPYAEGKVFVASEVKGPLVDRISYLHKIKKEIKQRVKDNYKKVQVGFVTVNTDRKEAGFLNTKVDLHLDPSSITNSTVELR